MKAILMFYRDDCGYCDMAFRALKELESAHPEYAEIPFRKVEETQDPVYADKFDYYATPTFYVGDEKIFEAHIGLKYDQMKDEVEKVFRTAAER
ncbi:MAG: thioredoxin family protein [Lachnospiraceae bacterium]|nr:thioredoxin family protein [Lachnospiraceae bacterium]